MPITTSWTKQPNYLFITSMLQAYADFHIYKQVLSLLIYKSCQLNDMTYSPVCLAPLSFIKSSTINDMLLKSSCLANSYTDNCNI